MLIYVDMATKPRNRLAVETAGRVSKRTISFEDAPALELEKYVLRPMTARSDFQTNRSNRERKGKCLQNEWEFK